MAKSFAHFSLGRDLPAHHRRDAPRMGLMSANQPSFSSGLGRMGPGPGPGPIRMNSLMDLGSSKLGQSGSRSMMSSGSSQGLPSIFSLGNRGPPTLPSQPSRDPDQASKILASFGLSSSDLDELSRYPEEKITAENLPQIIQHLKKRREDLALLSYRERLSRDTVRSSTDDWDDLRALRRDRFDDRPSSLNPVVDYDHGGRSRDLSFRDRLDVDERLRDRERLRDDSFLSDTPFRKLESDFDRFGYGQSQERPPFEKKRDYPSSRTLDDFHGLMPKDYPHICSLCDIVVHNVQTWNEHIKGRNHKKQCLLRLEMYPERNGPGGPGMGDPYMLHQSTNQAPGILGPPPPGFSTGGGPEGRHGNFRGPLGGDDMPGPRPLIRKGNGGRVVHVMEFERGKNLKFQLLQLAEPFGQVTNCLILNKINEAFIEMASPEEADAVVDYFSMHPALVFGKPVGVHLSQKYKRIKKPEIAPSIVVKRDTKPDLKSDIGRVIHLSNLPQSGYSDSAVINLAEAYGKVKNYILMRMRNQAFIEMDRAEDAQSMVDRCTRTPLFFQGKTLKVGLSQRYKKLVLRIPNASVDKLKEKNETTEKSEKNSRKRAHSPDSKDGKVKQKKDENSENDADKSAQVVTTEDMETTEEIDQKDLVSGSCEPELVDEAEEAEAEEDEAAALLETSSSVGDEAEVPDVRNLDQGGVDEDQSEAQEPLTSTPSTNADKKKSFVGNMEDFVTLDEVGDEDDMGSRKPKSSGDTSTDVSAKRNRSAMASTSVEEPEPTKSQTVPDSESAAETSSTATDYELGPFQANNPVGVEYVIPKTGFYCKLCSLFYTSEEVAKVSHCSTLAHYQKLKKILNKSTKGSEKKN